MTIGYGYGSEWHLLRWMGRHRQKFDQQVLGVIGHGTQLDWLDCTLIPGAEWPDAEVKGLDFIPTGDPVRALWEQRWPQTGNVPNWDAVGRLQNENGSIEWLLVEAKAHIGEIKSSCKAKANGGLPLIDRFLNDTKQALGIPASCDWLTDNYQLANRIAHLHFLLANGVRARLILIYFTGDHRPGWTCPQNQQGWQPALQRAKGHLGLLAGHNLASHIYELYLPVA